MLALFLLAASAWTPELSMRVQTIGDVVPSPDGRYAAYIQNRAVMEPERSEQVGQVWLARTDGAWRVQLTRGEKGASAPAFSPDGRYLYFLSDRSGKMNVWRIAVEGGEAERLTDWTGSIGVMRVSPDGQSVAFAGAPEDKDEEQRKKEKRDLRIVDEDRRKHTLWLISSGGGKEPRALRTPGHIGDLDWAPDSKSIAFEHTPDPLADYWSKADISEVEVAGGTVKPLASSEAAESSPRYSRDGAWLAYVRSGIPPRWAGEGRLMLRSRETGEVRELPATFDERPTVAGWLPGGLAVTETRGARTVLSAIPVDGPERPLYATKQGILASASVNLTGTHVGFYQESSGEAPEAFVMPLAGGTPVRVSRANDDLEKPPIGKTEAIRWKSSDGLEIEGLLTYPVGYKPGTRVPLILNIHGGPMGVFTETFLGRFGIYPLAAFAARGYAILRPNPRGSSGYGRKFRFMNLNDWGGKDYEDLMSGVDRAIAMGVADPEKLAVMGWSYGGYMTSWVIGHTNRFKAAVVGAAVTNLWSFTGTSDIMGFLPDYFSGQPWDNFEPYRKHSPMTYVKNAVTPALILHGEGDVRVPISQGYELYNALKQRGVKTQMVVYPRMPHGPREPKFILDIMQRHLDWVERYVGKAGR